MPTAIVRYSNSTGGNAAGGDGTTNVVDATGTNSSRAYAGIREGIDAVASDYPDFVSSDVQVTLNCTGSIEYDSVVYVCPSMTTDSTRYLALQAIGNTRHAGYYNPSKCGLTTDNGGSGVVSALNSNIRIDGLQFVNTSGSNVNLGVDIEYGTAGTCVLNSCVLHSAFVGTNAGGMALSWTGVAAKNLYMVNCVLSGQWDRGLNFNYGDTCVVYKTDIVGCSNGLFIDNTSAVYLKQNVIQRFSGSTDVCFVIGTSVGSITTDRNVSDDATSPDANYRNLTAQFTNISAFVLSLASGDTVLKGQGTDMSADGVYATPNDIRNLVRTPQFDIGAFKYVKAANNILILEDSMQFDARQQGTTSVIEELIIRDASGVLLAGLTNASAGLTMYYTIDANTPVAVTLASMTLGTYTSGGFKEIDATNKPGAYQYCPPNLALASGQQSRHQWSGASTGGGVLQVDLTGSDPRAAALTTSDIDAVTVEPGLDVKGWRRVVGSMLSGLTTGAGTTSEIFKSLRNDGTIGKTRVTLGNDGTNRTTRTVDVTDEV